MAFKYTIGDRVRIKSIDWYYKTKNEYDNVDCGSTIFIPDMVKYCEKIVTISSVLPILEVYHIKEDGGMFNWTDEMIEELVEEEAKPELKFKVGNRVRIKSLDWYNKNKTSFKGTNFVDCDCGRGSFTDEMVKYCGEIVTIESIDPYYGCYFIKEDGAKDLWTDEMIECEVEEGVKNWADVSIPDGPYTVTYDSPSMNDSMSKNMTYNEIILPEGYIFKDENGNEIMTSKIILEKKKKGYPKTYEECRDLIEGSHVEPFCADLVATGYLSKLMERFARLIMCRNAYWELYGEEMGLGKPWKPDYDSGVNKYGIICMNGVVQESNPTTNWERHLNKVLDFPTAEMRDTFKKNFDPDIDFCKEFL